MRFCQGFLFSAMTWMAIWCGYAQADVFDMGAHKVDVSAISKGEHKAPKNTLVFVPEGAENLPVIFFDHGFMLSHQFYTELLTHVASHGYVVVAPQLYAPGGLPFGKPNKEKERDLALDVIHWIQEDLNQVLGGAMDPDVLGLLGHSRGGTVGYMLAVDSLLPQALATIDPVDTTKDGTPAVIQGPFDFNIPSLIFGTGLGGVSKSMGGACAPEKDNHVKFYVQNPSPAYHMLLEDYGHMDMLDQNIKCGMLCNVCAKAADGLDKTLARRQIAGTLVHFFDASLKGQSKDSAEMMQALQGVAIKTLTK